MAQRYSPQFKASAVEQVHRPPTGQTIPQIAQLLGVGESTLNKWLADDKLHNGTQMADEQKRIKALEAENKHLREVNDILKKASAYFASQSK